MADRFNEPKEFPTGVRWNPTDYRPIDQTIYIKYANQRAEQSPSAEEIDEFLIGAK